ncbi:unnamed protein product [Adineta steineri]|uniref:Ionotropic glutamate receptor C-terminal domain-containing protein n=1 Tax=Adineta steineri TaxID=433720 RepID=A0A814XPR3_9BILA|nr:unnamed protein product [Adineta steineri]CAF3808657.1 unnamed protein product [Adineta steineri]
MSSWCNIRWLLLQFIVGQFTIHHVEAVWPLSNSSHIQLLGLFRDISYVSEATKISIHSHAMFQAAILLSQKYNITIEGQYLGWQIAQTNGDLIDALSSACLAISTSNVVGIVGPELSREAHILAALGKTVGIPVVSFSATDPDLSNRMAYPAFYRTVPSDIIAAAAIVKLFIRFNWTSCIIIYQNDVYGSGGANAINRAFLDNDLTVREMLMFDIATLNIRGDLKISLKTSPTRIILVWAQPMYTSLIMENALMNDVLGPQFTWILSTSIPLNSFNLTYRQKLIGMLTIEPVIGSVVHAPINTTLLEAAYNIWQQYEPETFPGPGKVADYALFAFDATWLLIQALNTFCSTTNLNSSFCTSRIEPTYCFDRRFSDSDLFLHTVSMTHFIGVSGPMQFSVNETDRINGTYYYLRNVQPASDSISFVPVAEYFDPDHWATYEGANVIIWPGNSLVPPTGQALLEGVNLRIGVVESTPFTIISNRIDEFNQNITKLVGYVPDLIELLRMKLKFNPTITLAPSNQTYAQLVDAVAHGVYDIVIGDVTITAARRELVAFSNSIFDNSLRIVMRNTPAVTVDLLSYMNPFSRTLWLLILIGCVYAGLLLSVIERQENEALRHRSLISSVAMSIWYSFGNLVGYGVDFDVTTAAGRLLTMGLYMLSLVLVATYTANLASDLTISKSKDTISGIEDMKNGKIPFNRIGIRLGTASEDFYLREISNGIQNFYPLKSRQEQYNSLLAGIIDATFLDVGVAEYMTNNIYCNLTLVGSDIDKSAFGVVTPKQWLYAHDLDVNILSLREAGALDELKRKWFQSRTCSLSSEISTTIEVEALGGLFLSFAVITTLSLLLFLWYKRFIIANYLLLHLGRMIRN